MIDAIHYELAENGLRDPADLAGYWSGVIRNVARTKGFVTIICHAHVTGVDPARVSALEKVLRLALDLGIEILPCGKAIQRAEHMA